MIQHGTYITSGGRIEHQIESIAQTIVAGSGGKSIFEAEVIADYFMEVKMDRLLNIAMKARMINALNTGKKYCESCFRTAGLLYAVQKSNYKGCRFQCIEHIIQKPEA